MDLFVIIGRCEISISFGSFAHIETDLFINGQTHLLKVHNCEKIHHKIRK